MIVQQQSNTAVLQRSKYLQRNLKVCIYQKDGKKCLISYSKGTGRMGKVTTNIYF